MLDFFSSVISDFKHLIPGFFMTMRLTFISFILAALIGLLLALLRMRIKKGIIFAITNWYINLFRCTPLLVQLLTIYFFVGIFLETTPFTAAAIGLSLNVGAYMCEAYRGVIESIHKGQWEAAKSLGMTTFMTLRRIILPQSIRILLPQITNYFVMVLLSSSLASVLALRELTLLGRSLVGKTLRIEVFFWVALFYFMISYPMSRLSSFLEKKWRLK